MASLARTVPSLARTVLKPSVLQPRGTRRQRQLVLTDGMGWDGWDGMDGMGYQKCPSIFFKLCEYIDKVYTYLFTH